jgi:1-acyl-sn-glycerol-3-phosphate acyltransferase
VFYWLLKRIILGPLMFTVFRPWVKGEENVPEFGGAILASNHLSFSDSIFLPLVVKRRVTFLAKADYFTGGGLKGRATALFFRGVGQIPMDRSGGKASDAALNSGLKVLGRGHLMGIYPEGTRSLDGRLYRGKTGVARMALEAGVPVIPVAMVGTDKVQPIGRRIPHVGRVGIVIGEPLDFSRYEGMAEDRYVLRSVTDEIMYALMELSGQEYVDIYASTMKERLAAAKRKTSPVVAAAGAVTAAANAVSERVERVAERGRSAADQAGSLTGSHDGAAHEAAREAAREAAGGTADEESPDVDATG